MRRRHNTVIKYFNNIIKIKDLNADSFDCDYWEECYASTKWHSQKLIHQYSGGTAGLMPFYDVRYQGKEIRVLIIGKEESHDPHKTYGTSPNFATRSKDCLATIYSNSRTFHIQGTLQTLQKILGESEYVYASYALSNVLRCAFQKAIVAKNTSELQDTSTMRRNCMGYLVDEIKILEPTLIIAQGRWAVDASLISRLVDSYGPAKQLMKNQANSDYGLYGFSSFMCITSHHPSAWNRDDRFEPALWQMIDHLKSTGYLPVVSPEDAKEYERLVKPRVDEMIGR